MPKLAVVIPTYNEAENIVVLVAELRSVLSRDALIIVVDDNSPDGTAQKVRDFSDSGVILIKREAKQGLGSAYRAGFARALESGVEVVVQMDADLSHDPKYIATMLAALENSGLVVGSRYIDSGAISGWSLWRHFCSRAAMTFARAILRLPTRDVTSGYRVWRSSLLRDILQNGIRSNGYAFQEEMLYRAHTLGARIVEAPILFVDRRHGRSKLHISDVVEFFFAMIRLRFF